VYVYYSFCVVNIKCKHITHREKITLSDGGHVCLDWCNEKDIVEDSESSRPTVIILPGLAGQREYYHTSSAVFMYLLVYR